MNTHICCMVVVLASAFSINAFPAGPASQDRVVLITKQANDNNFDGSFNYNFESEDGIAVSSNGYLKNAGTKEEAQVIEGSYSYTAPDGTPILVKYFSDETGFHAEGAHLPVAPPVPEAIARSLEYLKSLPPSKDDQY